METARPLLTPSSSSSGGYEPNAKRQALPSKKVCIICNCWSVESGDDDYHIFIVDLNPRCNIVDAADEFFPMAPTFRVDRECFDASAFCVLNSMLYMFEGYDPLTERQGKSVVTFDLSSADVLTGSNFKLERSMLRDAPDMLHTKDVPRAIPTPDGRILVFSSVIRFFSSLFDSDDEFANKIDFEVYDPATKSWHKLPGICDNWRDNKPCITLCDNWRDNKPCITFWIQACTFLTKSILFLITEMGMFTLDLESPNREGWKKLYSLAGEMRIPVGDSFLVIGNELCLTPMGAYDIEKENGFSRGFYIPLSSLGADCELPIYRAITLVDEVDNGECNFCIVQTSLNRGTQYPHLTIDVCSCNLLKYREDKLEVGGTALLSTISVKSFKFLLNAQRYCWCLPVGLYSI